MNGKGFASEKAVKSRAAGVGQGEGAVFKTLRIPFWFEESSSFPFRPFSFTMVYQQEQTDADKNNPDNEKLKGNGEIV